MNHDEQVPFEVMDQMPETGDLSTQEGGDVMETAYKVPLTILEVKVDRIKKKDDPKVELFIKLNVRMEIGPDGVDGNGKLAKRRVTARLLTWYNEDLYQGEWWKKKARFDYKSFLKALDYDPAKPPKINDAFLAELKTQETKADILKKPRQIKDAAGKYVAVEGEFENVITNFRAIKK